MAYNERSRKNLKPFKQGHDERRNMEGPKKLPEIAEILNKVLGDEKNGKTAAEDIIAALKKKAAGGDVRAAELLLDRAYGKVKQVTEFTGVNQEPACIKLPDGTIIQL